MPESSQFIGAEIEDEDYGRGRVLFATQGFVTVRFDETGILKKIPETALTAEG